MRSYLIQSYPLRVRFELKIPQIYMAENLPILKIKFPQKEATFQHLAERDVLEINLFDLSTLDRWFFFVTQEHIRTIAEMMTTNTLGLYKAIEDAISGQISGKISLIKFNQSGLSIKFEFKTTLRPYIFCFDLNRVFRNENEKILDMLTDIRDKLTLQPLTLPVSTAQPKTIQLPDHNSQSVNSSQTTCSPSNNSTNSINKNSDSCNHTCSTHCPCPCPCNVISPAEIAPGATRVDVVIIDRVA